MFTRKEIAVQVLDRFIQGKSYERTIDAHVKNLRQKIENNPRTPQYIGTVYGVGDLLR